jgi:hypothetical protein
LRTFSRKNGSVANFRGGSTFLQNQAQAGCSLCAESLILRAADDHEGVDGPDNVHPVTCVRDSPGRILQKLPRLPFIRQAPSPSKCIEMPEKQQNPLWATSPDRLAAPILTDNNFTRPDFQIKGTGG